MMGMTKKMASQSPPGRISRYGARRARIRRVMARSGPQVDGLEDGVPHRELLVGEHPVVVGLVVLGGRGEHEGALGDVLEGGLVAALGLGGILVHPLAGIGYGGDVVHVL